MNYRKHLSVKPDSRVKLDRLDPSGAEFSQPKDTILALTETNRDRITDLQNRIYAERRHSVLIVLQGLDAAGKDGVVKHTLSAVNPLSCTATAFKKPCSSSGCTSSCPRRCGRNAMTRSMPSSGSWSAMGRR